MVRADVAHCAAQDSDETWPEDVYAAVRFQQAWLLYITAADQYAGMAVLTSRRDPFNPRKSKLIVWLCRTHSEGAMEAGLKVVEGMAAVEGHSMVSFHGSRLSFDRWGKKHGFEFDSVALHKQVNNHG